MKTKALKALLVYFAIILLFALSACSSGGKSETVTVDILKIGKADCIVIDTGKNVVIIDTGEAENLNSIHSYMDKKGYDTVNALILTHNDKDHIGGAADIISKYNVTRVYESARDSSTEEYRKYHDALYNKGEMPIKLYEDFSFELDGCKFEIMVPQKLRYNEKNTNNSSLVIAMEHGKNRFLFCGDAMEERLEELISADMGKFDFIKLPYHGNYLRNYRDFLDKSAGKYGAVTCSNKNPADERALSLFEEYGIIVYQTKNGTVTVKSDGNAIIIEQ